MILNEPRREAEFDQFSGDYDDALARGISISGEDRNYFARGRIVWLAGCLRELNQRPASVIDFGCGTGASVPLLFELLGIRCVTGIDVSSKSLEVACRTWDSQPVRFEFLSQYDPAANVDLIFCNGVFHHVPPAERPKTLHFIYRSLRPGGVLAFWENNPWNPGTRYVMKRIPFDRDAITISSSQASRLLRSAGFEVLRTDYLFIFPRFLSRLRFIEPKVSRFPIGTQYQVLCRKP